jgi:hypothetical protein
MGSLRRPGTHRLGVQRRGNLPARGGVALTPTPVVVLSREAACVTLRMPALMPPPARSAPPPVPPRASAPPAKEPPPTRDEPIEHASFFAQGDAQAHVPAPDATVHEEPLELDPTFEPRMRPEARARRARLLTVVTAALVVATLLIVVAGMRRSLARAAGEAPARVQPSSRAAETASAAQEIALLPPVPLATAPLPDPTVTPDPAPAPAAPVPTETAAQEKRRARAALEAGALKKAIAGGERSVALDPTDAEAWLLLGAAYQMRGLASDAHRAFASCVREGRVGPVGECRALLR